MYYPVVLSFAMHHICTTLTPSCHAQPRTTENAWECLRTPVFFWGLVASWSRGLVVPSSRRPVVSLFRCPVVPLSRRPAVSRSRRLAVSQSRSLVVPLSRSPVVPSSRGLVGAPPSHSQSFSVFLSLSHPFAPFLLLDKKRHLAQNEHLYSASYIWRLC